MPEMKPSQLTIGILCTGYGVPHVTRTAQLKMLGDGVVPQQATIALRLLLEQQEKAA